MRNTFMLLSGAAALFATTGVMAQSDDTPNSDTPSAATGCENVTGRIQDACLARAASKTKKAKGDAPAAAPDAKGGKGLSKQDAELVNSTNASAQAKAAANDFAGAAADYQKAIDASPNNPARHVLYAGLAMALRRQGVAAYNGGTRPALPPSGASNDTIRAYNAAVLAAQNERTAAAVPLIKRAMEAAATAAAGADASSNKAADTAIGVELRENAGLLYRLDTRNTLTVARPSIVLEADWLKRWIAATNPLAETLAAKYGMAVAANLAARDKAAGLTLADEIKAKSGNDADGAVAYAEIVAAAKTPVGDAHRAQATAWLTAVEPSIADTQVKRRVAELKTALSAAS